MGLTLYDTLFTFLGIYYTDIIRWPNLLKVTLLSLSQIFVVNRCLPWGWMFSNGNGESSTNSSWLLVIANQLMNKIQNLWMILSFYGWKLKQILITLLLLNEWFVLLNNWQEETRWIATGINSSKWMTCHSDNIWELWMISRFHGWKMWQVRITLPGWAIGDGSLCGEVCLHHTTSYAWIGNHTRQRWWSHRWPFRMTAVSTKQIDQRWISTLCLFVSCIGKSQLFMIQSGLWLCGHSSDRVPFPLRN